MTIRGKLKENFQMVTKESLAFWVAMAMIIALPFLIIHQMSEEENSIEAIHMRRCSSCFNRVDTVIDESRTAWSTGGGFIYYSVPVAKKVKVPSLNFDTIHCEVYRKIKEEGK